MFNSNNNNNNNNDNNNNNNIKDNNEELVDHNYQNTNEISKVYIKYFKNANNKTESSFKTEIRSLNDEIDEYSLSIDEDVVDKKSNYIILSEIIINNKNELLKQFDKSMFIYNDHGKITNAILILIEYNKECIYKKINNNFINIYKIFFDPDLKNMIDCQVNTTTIKHLIDYINKNFNYDEDLELNNTEEMGKSESKSESKNSLAKINLINSNNKRNLEKHQTEIVVKNSKKFVNYIGKEIILISPNRLISIYNNSTLFINDQYLGYLQNNIKNLINVNDKKLYINIDINMNNNIIDVKLYNKINDNFGYIYTDFLKKYNKKFTTSDKSIYVKKYVIAKILEEAIEMKKINNIDKIPKYFHNSIYYFGFELDNILIPLFQEYGRDFIVTIPLYLKLYITVNNTVKKETMELLTVIKNGILYIYLFEIIDNYFDYKVYDILLNKLSTQIEMLISSTLLYNEYNKIKFGGIVINDNIKFKHKRIAMKIIKFYENYFNMLYFFINRDINPNEIIHFFGGKMEEYFIKFLNLVQKITGN